MGPSFELLQRALGGPKNTSNQFNQSSIDSLCLKKVCDGDPKMWPPLQNRYFWINVIFFKHLTWIKIPLWSNMAYLIKKCFHSINLVFYLDILGKIYGEYKTWPPLHKIWNYVCLTYLKKDIPILMLYIVFVG